MSIPDPLQRHPGLGPLLAANDFRQATALLTDDTTASARAAVADLAVEHWLREADVALDAGDRKRMNACLAEAARFRRDDHAPLFRETRRRVRGATLEVTMAPHWVELVHAASLQRAHYFGGTGVLPPGTYDTFTNPRLLEQLGIEPEQLDALDTRDLTSSLAAIAGVYPAELRDQVHRLGSPFARASVAIAGGRPDLAVLELLELPDREPVVCLERARVAYAVGFPATSVLALADFVRLHGSHVVLRRLHTGVFMAQMANTAGDVEQAVRILDDLPHDAIGRRPVLLLARLLRETGRDERATTVLETWCANHPDDTEAHGLLHDAP